MYRRFKSWSKRGLTMLMVLVLCLGMLPVMSYAQENTYTRVTSAAQLQAGGSFVLVASTDTGAQALGSTIGSKIDGVPVTVNGTNLSGTNVPVWTVSALGTGISLSNGTNYLGYGSSTSFTKPEESYTWNVTDNQDGTFRFVASTSSTRAIAWQISGERFGAYSTTNNASEYVFDLLVFRVDSGDAGITVAAPQAQPQGGEVASGTAITLTCATQGASIYYTTDSSDPSETSNRYTEDTKPVITGEAGAQVILKAVAVLDDTQSAIQTIRYTIQGPATAQRVETIAEGDVVTVYYPEANKVMSIQGYTYTSSSGSTKDELVALDAQVSDDTLTIPEGAAQFKVYEQDGHYVLKSDEGFLYLDGTNVRLVEEQGEYTLFDLEETENGSYVKGTNAVAYNKPQYLEYYGGYFTCYSMNTSKPELYTFQFYRSGSFDVNDEPLVPDDGQEGETPIAAGDQVVIYAPDTMLALSATVKSTYYPVGVTVKLEEGTLSGYEATEVWTVGGDAATGFTFTNGGKTLSMAGSYSSVYPGAGENETWTLEASDTTGVYYVKNQGRGNYLLWDDKYDDWTTSESDKTGVVFQVVDGVPEPEPEPTQLEVRATPASGASLTEAATIELMSVEGATIYYTTDGSNPTTDSKAYTQALTVGEDVAVPTADQPLTLKAIAYLPADEEAGTQAQTSPVAEFTYQAPVSLNDYNLYFGQLHSHTNISDGAGSVEEAFDHASQVENLDFLAVTDHSNSFDNESADGVGLENDCSTISSEWAQGHEAAANATTEDFVGLYGFEMTWSDGFGHMNTFNTPGFESRSNSEFGNKSGSTEGYQNYYNMLLQVSSSLSQFNHPGTTFGDFQDFAFYSAALDQRITLIEVGNGEGAIGSSGYFPSYEYYTRALDKGWHVAPTNNQDNHKGNWGDSNTARSVVLASDLTEQGIYDAIANYRVYATEDNDLSILYSLNGNAMGSILPQQEQGVTIQAQISDPTDSGDAKVEVIVNGGLVAASKTLSGCNGTVTFTFDSNDYSYYYLRITQADQNIAVTAPVWTGEGVNAGISSTGCDQELVVRGEAVNLSSEIYNNAGSDMTIQSLTYSVDGEVVYTVNTNEIGTNGVLASGATAQVSFPCTFDMAGKTTVDVSLVSTIGGTEYTFTGVLQLNVTDPSLVTRILVDGTHYNDYVTGYYSGNMGNFTALAAEMNAQVTIKQPGETITAEDLENVSLLVVSAPLKKEQNGVSPTQETNFSEEYIQMVADYAKNGGTVILCGLADYQDSYNGAPFCSTEQINPILVAMGATLRLNDDEVLDDDTNYNGGATQTYRVYMDNFNTQDFPQLFEGLQEGQVYSAYSGCSVDLGENGQALVMGSSNCYSINSNLRPEGSEGQWDSGKDKGSTTSGSYDASTAVVKKGDVVTLATEAVGQGRVYVAGTVFLSNFEISDSSSVDYGDASYANKVIAQNIVSSILEEREISTIAEAREGEVGDIFTVEGVVTAGNVEPNAFFDTIYIQDETGGIDLYPVSSADGTFLVGQTVRVTGSWDQYQGDVELRVIDIELVDSTIQPVEPKELTLEQANDYDTYGGWLAKVRGTVTSVELVSEQVSEVMLSDGTHEFRLLFNNYIGYSQDGSTPLETFAKVGAHISAVGVVYYDPDGACLRIRDRSEVELVDDQQPEEDDTTKPGDGTTTQPGDDASKPGQSTDDSGDNTGNTTDNTAKPDGDKNPQTGDTHQMIPSMAVLVVALGALCGVVTLRKRVRR